ncbi:MAG: hypothetical protein ABJP48_00205 [Erythrobacter sp.]
MIWLLEQREPGFLAKSKSLTAGQISGALLNSAASIGQGHQQEHVLSEIAQTFSSLVEDRNRLMHGNPFTADGGEQRLTYTGRHGQKDWTICEMDNFSDRLAELSIAVGRLIHSE